ncbi:MAG: hypothetical protein VX278_22640 [Myxococcota bacterium]|nr:hypothetical protein [Myxococcota bacterium]
MRKALGIHLEEDESVSFCYELELSKIRSAANISAVILFLIGFIFPLMFLLWPLAGYTIYKSRNPNDDLIVGLLLTNKRFVQIHFNEAKCRAITIPVRNISKVDCNRKDIRVRGGRGLFGLLTGLLGSWALTKTRNHFQDKNEKTSEAYWDSTRSLILTYNGAQTHQINVLQHKIDRRVVKKLGALMATGTEEGWNRVGQTAESIPEERKRSLL